eukprot:54859_1
MTEMKSNTNDELFEEFVVSVVKRLKNEHYQFKNKLSIQNKESCCLGLCKGNALLGLLGLAPYYDFMISLKIVTNNDGNARIVEEVTDLVGNVKNKTSNELERIRQVLRSHAQTLLAKHQTNQ